MKGKPYHHRSGSVEIHASRLRESHYSLPITKRVRHTGEQIVDRLRDGEAMLACGKDLAHVLQTLGIAESTWQRWRKQYGGMRPDEAKRLREYLEARGAYYYDDYGDPYQPYIQYSDGDHLRAGQRLPYTERFAQRHAAFLQ